MEVQATPYSSLKIFHHVEALKKLERGERLAPIYIRIKPTNCCNHKCYYCSYADNALGLRDSVRKQDQISWDKMQEIIQDMKDMGVKAVTFSGGGEPLVYPYIVEAMKKILEAGIDLSIITNGQLLKDERARVLTQAKWVRISCDAVQAGTYAKIRNLPEDALLEVWHNIEQFAKSKPDTCELGVNFVIHHENYKEIYAMAKKMKSLGVNHIKYAARITKDLFEYHEPFKNEAVSQVEQAKRDFEDKNFRIIDKYASDFDTAMVFERKYKKCYINQIFTVIAADSKIYFCHDKAYVSSGVVADLKETSLREAWFSSEVCERYKTFNAEKECCHHCVYDDRNLLLNSFFSLDQKHINFI